MVSLDGGSGWRWQHEEGGPTARRAAEDLAHRGASFRVSGRACMGRCLCGGCCQLSRPSRKQLVGSNGVACSGSVLFESLLYSVELGSSRSPS